MKRAIYAACWLAVLSTMGVALAVLLGFAELPL